MKNIFQSVGSSLLGLPSTSQEAFSVNYLTLTFKGEMEEYEKSYQEDYFIKSLNPFRFSLILSMIFYGAFAFLDTVAVPQLKVGLNSAGPIQVYPIGSKCMISVDSVA
jgi:hypothetical protein